MFEPVLSKPEQDNAHKVFNNLFLSYEFLEDSNTIIVKRNHRAENEKDIYLAVNLYTKSETMGEIEYEIDKETVRENRRFNAYSTQEINDIKL